MRLTWQYGKVIHGSIFLQWTHWVENVGPSLKSFGVSRYMVWDNNSGRIILDITVND